MAIAGRVAIIAVSTDGTTFSTVDDLNSAQLTIGGNQYDVSKFGDTAMRRLIGLADATWNLAGSLSQGDTNGQAALITAKIAGTNPWVMFKPNGTAGWKQQVAIGDVQIQAIEDGPETISLALMSAGGTITTV